MTAAITDSHEPLRLYTDRDRDRDRDRNRDRDRDQDVIPLPAAIYGGDDP